jgi:hypothetical protein
MGVSVWAKGFPATNLIGGFQSPVESRDLIRGFLAKIFLHDRLGAKRAIIAQDFFLQDPQDFPSIPTQFTAQSTAWRLLAT